MKKVVLASLLSFAMAAPAVNVSFAQTQQPANPQAGNNGQVQMSQEEYAAYNNANTQSDPKAKAAAFEAYLKAYPNSAVKADVLDQLVYLYASQNDKANALSAADRLLAIQPSNLRALTIEVFFRKADADALTDPAAKAAAMDQFTKYAQAGLSASKPKDMSDADWTKMQAQTKVTFESALGDAALAKKDWPGAVTAFKAELAAAPAEATQTPGAVLQDIYFLAQAYMGQGDFLNCAWYATRADVYAGQFASQIEPLAKYCYHKYHGNTDDQWATLQGLVKTSLNPPADLGTQIKPAPKPEDIVANLIATTPDLATLAPSDKEFMLQYGTHKDPKTQTKDASGNVDPNSGKTYADEVFDTVKGKSAEFPGVLVIEATPDAVKVAVSDDAVQSKTADFVFNMKEPLKTLPKAGEKITVQGTYSSYTTSPNVIITMTDSSLVEKKTAPAKKPAPAHHTTTHTTHRK